MKKTPSVEDFLKELALERAEQGQRKSCYSKGDTHPLDRTERTLQSLEDLSSSDGTGSEIQKKYSSAVQDEEAVVDIETFLQERKAEREKEYTQRTRSTECIDDETGPKATFRTPKFVCSWIIGFAFLLSVAIALGKLYRFLQSNDIEFWRPDPGTATISIYELAYHDQPDKDCWIAFHGKVYDMNRYPKRHPGTWGAAGLTPHCGRDGTEFFSQYHDESLLKMVVGERLGFLESPSN